jgi:cardiolipin synthase
MFVEEYLVELKNRRYTPAAFGSYIRKCVLESRRNLYRNPHGARSVVANAVGFFAFFLAVAVLLALYWDGGFARRFIVVESWAVAVSGIWMLAHLSLLRDPSGIPQGRIGLPNQLSLLRALLVPAIYLFLVERYYGMALATYALAGASDVLDGFLARRLHLETRLGLVLDPIVDVAYIVSIFTALAHVGWIPSWLHGLVMARYIVLVGGTLFLYLARGSLTIHPTGYGKLSGVIVTMINFLLMGMGALGQRGSNADVLAVLYAGLGFLFAAAIVQLLFIGIHNLHGGDARTAEHTKVAGRLERAPREKR